jgi:hypothetical protein
VANHIQSLSKEKIAFAQDGNGFGGNLAGLLDFFNPILFLNFIVAILAAVNDFLVRKDGAS